MMLTQVLMVACLGGAMVGADERTATVVQGRFEGVSPTGALIIQSTDGKTHTIPVSSATQYFEGLAGQRSFDGSQITIGSRARSRLMVTLRDGVAERVVVGYDWYEVPALWLEEQVHGINAWAAKALGEDALLANYQSTLGLFGIILVSLICGLVSSLVVSNRMAFFSDALAHSAFAGVALGILFSFFEAFATEDGILLVMVAFGVAVGLAIAYVKERTTLANDTVIGVFFAASMGFGAILLNAISRTGSRISPENFLFGDLLGVTGGHLVYLLLVAALTLGYLLTRYNAMVFSSFNPSLARSRRFHVRFGNYLFIALLAVVVNTCLKMVGALLINALLVLPAAAAANTSRTMRQFFWTTLAFSMFAGISGFLLSLYWVPVISGRRVHLGTGGVIVLIGVAVFLGSMLVGRWARGNRPSLRLQQT
jgi:zinc transport system permease protein